MAHRVVWFNAAVDDVEAIADFISRDSVTYASAVVRRLIQAAASVGEFPQRGRVVPEWGEESVREVYVHRYRLMYRVRQDRIEILTVIHGARLLPNDLRDRN